MASGDVWSDGGAYERFMGRWSRRLAPEFVRWLDPPREARWADVGCGTGALTQAVLDLAEPSAVTAIEPSAGFLAAAREAVHDPRVTFRPGSVEQLEAGAYDVVVAGLVLNFVPDADAAVRAFVAAAPAGTVGAYVWAYEEGMPMLDRFWEVARALSPEPLGQRELEDAQLRRPEALEALWHRHALTDVEIGRLTLELDFDGFDDLWTPFLGGVGPAPAYLAELDDAERTRLREAFRAAVTPDADGHIRMAASAWAVRGRAPG